MHECPDCRESNDETAERCAHCGCELFEELSTGPNGNAFADLSVHRGHTAAFLQLNDILTNNLPLDQTRTYLSELNDHLEREAARFEKLPPIWQDAAYTEGVALIVEGLLVLQEVVQHALREQAPPPDWLQVAMEADLFLREGTDLLAASA